METKTFPCTIHQRWMDSLESAYISITTPKGTTLMFDKWPKARLKNHWDKNDDVKELIWNIYKVSSTSKTINLTKEQVMLLKGYSNEQDDDLVSRYNKRLKKSVPSFAQRQLLAKRESQRGNIRAGICSCGADLILKDHKTWTGWYCSICKQGGSFNNK